MENKTTILLAGAWDLGPIGRHGLSFLSTLLKDERNKIYVDIDYTDNKVRKLLKDFLKKDFNRIIFTDKESRNFEFDFLIYFHVLGITPSTNWFECALEKKSKIKICYPVFDGTVPPLEWIDKINNNFDICLSPSEYCAHNLKRHGVNIDCLGLECVVLIDDFLSIQREQKSKFRFGCVSGNEARKNLIFLVKSFAQTFKKDDPVELFIHAVDRPNIITPFNHLLEVVKECQKTANIILSNKFISHSEMLKIWKSFDAYVIPQKNTGYYTTPLEALACGIPVILSDIPVHRELQNYVPQKDNLFFVKHQIYAPEYHFVFDYRNIGVSFDSTEELYKKAFKELYTNRGKLYSSEQITQRKHYASKFTATGLSKKHNIVLHPKNIVISSKFHISVDTETFYMSEKLYKKYANLGFISDVKNIHNSLKDIDYPEENSPVFQTIEKCAISSQNIWIERYNEKKKDKGKCNKILDSKWMIKLLGRANKSNINRLPRFIYKFFSLYCKIKSLKKKRG